MHISTRIYMFKNECMCLLLRMVDYNNSCMFLYCLLIGKYILVKIKMIKGWSKKK